MYQVYFEDITVGDVSEFGAYKVTREEIIDFASKYDPQPFHLDEEAAKKSVFGGLCASGWHTCAMLMRMLVDHLQDKGVASMGSPGIDSIKWIRPVMVGDTLHVRASVDAKRDSNSRPNLGLLKGTYLVSNQNGEKVMTMNSNYMVAKRNG